MYYLTLIDFIIVLVILLYWFIVVCFDKIRFFSFKLSVIDVVWHVSLWTLVSFDKMISSINMRSFNLHELKKALGNFMLLTEL